MERETYDEILETIGLGPEYYTYVASKLVNAGQGGYDSKFVDKYVVAPLIKSGTFENFFEATSILREVYNDKGFEDFERENVANAIREVSGAVVDMVNDSEFWETPVMNNAVMACMQGLPEDVTRAHCQAVFSSNLRGQYYPRIAQVQPEIASEVAGMTPTQIEYTWGNPPVIECPEIVE